MKSFPVYEPTEASLAIARPKSLTASVAAKLKEMIIDGSIPLGSRLSENQIAEHFGTSKTPVREAFVQLQSTGLLIVLPQRGGMVFRPTDLQVRELCETRLELEGAALRHAFERNRASLVGSLEGIVTDMTLSFGKPSPARYQIDDNAFHLSFFEHCSNSLLREAYELFLPRIRALRTNLSTPDPYLLERSYREHGEMVRLLKQGNVVAVADILAVHIARTQEFHTKRLMELELQAPTPAGG